MFEPSKTVDATHVLRWLGIVEFLAATFEIALAWKLLGSNRKLLGSNRTMECGRVRRWLALFRHKRCSWLSPGKNRTPLRLALRGRAMSRNTRGVDLNKLLQTVWPKNVQVSMGAFSIFFRSLFVFKWVLNRFA